jgi:hypothetical protein
VPDKAEFAVTDRATLDCAIAGMSIAVTHCLPPVGAWIVPGARFLQPVAFPQQGHCYRSTLIHVLRFRANDLCFGANVRKAFLSGCVGILAQCSVALKI